MASACFANGDGYNLQEVEAEEAKEDRKEAEHAAWLASRKAKKLEIQVQRIYKNVRNNLYQ